jgi:hypothetical protein
MAVNHEKLEPNMKVKQRRSSPMGTMQMDAEQN